MPHTVYVSPRSLGLPDPRPPAVETRELARLFGRSAALAGVSLRIEPGRLVALVGPNGAGKTTLLRIVSTAIRPTYGCAEVDGMDVVRFADAVRGRVAYLSHATGLYDELTARENLAFAATLFGLRGAEAEERISAVIDEVSATAFAGERVRGLSAGMRKRIALARLLLGAPALVLLDEPHASLDAEGMAVVDRMLGAWRSVGVTVLVASHAVERLGAVADGTIRLHGGLVAEASGDGIVARPPSPTGDTLVAPGAATAR